MSESPARRAFHARLAAALLVGLGALHLVVSLATGRSARAEVPPDLSPPPAELALDAWRAASRLVEEPGTAVVDLRPAEAFARYHLPGAVSLPGASVAEVVAAAAGAPAVLLYAGKDEVARQVAVELRRAPVAEGKVWYLADGARAWYLAFQLPVPLFAEASPPGGYEEALQAVRDYLGRAPGADGPRARAGLEALVKASYRPTLLDTGKKRAATGSGKKKISGGCG